MPILATGNKPQGFVVRLRSAVNGFTPCGRSAVNGFTLVELMVVITILALVASVAVVSLSDPRGRVISDAERFAARLSVARDSAIVEGRSIRVWATMGAYGVERWRRGVWQPMTEKPFEVRRWSTGIVAQVGTRAVVTFDATGLPSAPTKIELSRDGESAHVTVAGNGDIRAGS